jgi:hypothetical protein
VSLFVAVSGGARYVDGAGRSASVEFPTFPSAVKVMGTVGSDASAGREHGRQVIHYSEIELLDDLGERKEREWKVKHVRTYVRISVKRPKSKVKQPSEREAVRPDGH